MSFVADIFELAFVTFFAMLTVLILLAVICTLWNLVTTPHPASTPTVPPTKEDHEF